MNESNAPILKNLPVLPLKRTVLFPGTMMPLTVGRDRSIAAVEAALKTEDKTLLVVAQRDAQTDEPRCRISIPSAPRPSLNKRLARRKVITIF